MATYRCIGDAGDGRPARVLACEPASRGSTGAFHALHTSMELHSLETRLAPWTMPHDSSMLDPANFHARLIWQLADQTSIAPDRVATLVELTRVQSRAAFLMYRAAHGDADIQLHGRDATGAQICQFEATWRLATLVPADHPVWQLLRACQLELAEYIMDELAFVRGYRDARSLDRAAAIDLAIAKHGLARGCPYLLGALDAGFEPLRFEAPIRHFCLAVQALNDARDWQRDAARGRPSLVLAGVPPELELAAPDGVRTLQRWLIASGHLQSVIDFAAEHVELARGVVPDAPASRLAAAMRELQSRIAAVRALLPT